MIQFLKKRWVYHSIIWTLVYLLLACISYFNENTSDSFLSALKEPFSLYVPIMITTYLSFWAKDKLFDGRRYLLLFIAVLMIASVGVIAYELLIMLDDGEGNPIIQSMSNFTFVQVIAVGLQYFKRGIINQVQIQELNAKKAMIELNALKAQLNPHFLFNTLNNIYGMNQIDSKKGSEMIMELSDVMRYHLEFSKVGKVRLEDEIQLLQSYIKLEQLRLRDTCKVKVDFEDVDKSLMISPLLFIPFVENAFKHGTHPTKDCYVHIKLSTTPSMLFLIVENSFIANRKVVKTNIGLQNTKRRLELLLPEKHKLSIVKNEQFHLVDLRIQL